VWTTLNNATQEECDALMAASVPALAVEVDADSRGALSRRDFIKLSGGASAALGTLGALGMSLAPSVAHARTLRIQNAKAVPTVCPYCRSEEHTSELQSRGHLVCRLLLEKKKSN